MAIAKIGTLPDTLATRSITIPMRRKRFDEQVEKFDAIHHGPIVEELARKAVRWTKDNLQRLSDARPELPKALNNRAADNWTPLIVQMSLVVNGRKRRGKSL